MGIRIVEPGYQTMTDGRNEGKGMRDCTNNAARLKFPPKIPHHAPTTEERIHSGNHKVIGAENNMDMISYSCRLK